MLASHLARQLVFLRLGGGIIPLQIMVSMLEVDVLLVKYCSPLKGCCVLSLTGCAMAELGIQRHFSVQFILDSPAVTACFVDVFEIVIVVVNSVRCTLLPLFHAMLVLIRLLSLVLLLHWVGHLGCTRGGSFHGCCQDVRWYNKSSTPGSSSRCTDSVQRMGQRFNHVAERSLRKTAKSKQKKFSENTMFPVQRYTCTSLPYLRYYLRLMLRSCLSIVMLRTVHTFTLTYRLFEIVNASRISCRVPHAKSGAEHIEFRYVDATMHTKFDAVADA